MARVALLRGLDPVEVTTEALKAIERDVEPLITSGRPVLVKPNYITADHPSTGVTTDAGVVEGVVRFLKERGVEDVVIGEGSGFADTLEAFRAAGIDKVAEKWGVELIDLNRDELVEVRPPSPLALKKVKVARTALERAIVSVPKLKVHKLATVTLGLKNMMGALGSKGRMHNGRLQENIADLASVLKPSLTVIDGMVAGEVHETSRSPVRMNVVIASTDPVAADAVGALVMGIRPEEVKHLVLAERKGLGTLRLEEVEVVGEPVEKVARRFRRSLLSRLLSRI
ncbi:MAG: DUF362 domain-containing protein [Candidatus Nezhaarchaeota archaeon]|nr:DUF362 domain-containing protein [Candidatus Nezhaarchaeota archaeon]